MQRARTDHKSVLRYARRRVADARRYTLLFVGVASALRRVMGIGLLAAAAVPVTGFGAELVGKWRYDFKGLPTYFIFSDCGVLEIHSPGNSVEVAYRVKASGPPLQLEVCPPEGKDGSCSTVYVYLLGESLQIVPDTTLPRSNPALLTDMLMQRVPDEYNDAVCKQTPDSSPHAK